MSEDLVAHEQARGAARDRAAGTGQVVQLPEGPGESRLTALVRTGDDDHPFRPGEVEVVGHHGLAWRASLAARARSKVSRAKISLQREVSSG